MTPDEDPSEPSAQDIAEWRFGTTNPNTTVTATNHAAGEQRQQTVTDRLGRLSPQSTSRRTVLSHAAKVGGGALALSAGTGMAAAGGMDDSEGDNGDDGNGSEDNGDDGDEGVAESDLEILNFALTLEKLEATFYEEALASSGGTFDEHDIERSDAAKVFAEPSLRFSTFQYFEAIRDHERAHVDALTAAIEEGGGTPVSGLEFEFPYETVDEFVSLAQVFEDTGAAAYTGAAPMIQSDEYLAAAASILAVEARHASYLRVLNVQIPFPDAFQPAMTMEEVVEAVEPFIVSE